MKLSVFMKSILCAAMMLIAGIANATTYYVSNSGSNSNNGTSPSTPWQTLSKVQSAGNNGTIRAGDFILFKKGDSFTGTIMWATIYGGSCPSGTATSPITFGSYGTGAKPIFQAVTPSGIFWILGPSYIVIDGLNITDLTFPVNDKINKAPCQNGILIGEYNGTSSNNCTIKNCDMSNIGGGIVINGNFNVVDSCTITDLKNVQNTYSTTFPGNDNDYGANSLTITGNDNSIMHSYFSGAWAESEDYGWNGGAFEMFDNCNRNKFMYNTIVDCGGISEYGAFASAATAADNMFAYNKIINCGNLSWVNTNGTFAIQASNIMYYNNVIIENNNSRFSGPNTGAGIVTPRVLAKIAPEPDMLAFSGSPVASVVYNLKNNIFNLTTGGKIVRSSGVAAKTTHQDNIYKFSGGSTANYTLTTSELSTAAAIWTNTTPADPAQWNFAPTTASPAIDFGQNLGIAKDFAGNLVPTVPNAGILESAVAGNTLTAAATAGTIACNGGSATVTVSATGGTAPYTGTGTFTVNAGTFNYTVTDAAGGSSVATVTVSQPAAIVVTVTTGNIAVFGGTTTVTVAATGGTGTYTYSLNGGSYQSSNTFSSVAAGSHTVSVKDANGCTASKTFTLTQPTANPLAATSSAGSINCNGGTTNVTVSATGGTAPYTGAGTFSVNAGTYTYTVTDAAGATANTSVTVSQPSAIVVNVNPGTITVNGGSTNVTVSATGGTGSYTYKMDAGSYQASNTFTGVTAGSHTVTVKDANGCTAARNFTLTEPTALVAAVSATSIACNGGTATVTVGAIGGVAPYTGTGTFSVTAGTYTYTVTDANGATDASSITVTQPSAIVVNVTPGTITVFGGTTTVTVSATGGTGSYTYKLNSGSYQASGTFNNVAAGSHTITAKDANGCTKSKSFTLTQPANVLTATATAGTINCNGATTTVTVSAAGGTSPYTGTGTFTVSAGTYNYTVTDAAGGTSTTSVVVTQPAAIAVTVSAGTILVFGGTTSVAVNATGGTGAYTYKLDAGAYQSSNTFTGVAAGSHSVTVKDANGCTSVKNFTITQPANNPLVANSSASTINCNGGTATVTVSASGGTAPYTGAGTFTVNAGTYSYTVTDANGTTATTAITVSQPSAIVVTVNSGTIAVNGGTTSVTVSATGGTGSYTYKLNTGAYQASNTFNNVAAGTHSVTVKDANGCTSVKTFTISQPSALSATATAESINCNGATALVTVSATGGVAPYSGTGTFTVAAGTYNYTVSDASGASVITSVTVNQPAAIVVNVTSGTITVAGGTTSISVSASGGSGNFSYSLNGSAYQFANVFNGVASGNHIITVKDAAGCTTVKNFAITEPGVSPLVASSNARSITCNGGTTVVTVNAGGGVAPYTGTGTFTVTAGTYNYTVTDASGAIAVTNITIVEPTVIEAIVTTGTILTTGGTTSASVATTGGTAPYSYSLNGGAFQSGSTFSGIAAGNHNITIKDANGCSIVNNFSVTQSLTTTFKISLVNKTNVSCRRGADGSIEVIAFGGRAPYLYNINNGRYSPVSLFKNLTAGVYRINAKDATGSLVSLVVFVFDGRLRCSSTGLGGKIEINAYPNPTATSFALTIDSENDKDVVVEVMNLEGKKVHQDKGSFDKKFIFGNNFRSGTYFVRVTQGTDVKTLKVIKAN